ncbi:MAG TPA: hypothetical protein VK581_06895 [Chthoniobacterales bacterium]|nr:hypothetical protein [Chthoniobacterales bacterium]
MLGCGRTPETETPKADAPPAASPPSHAAHELQWITNDIPASMAAGKVTPVHVSVKNTGDWPWPDPFAANPSKPDGTYAVRLAYRWADSNGKVLPEDGTRAELKAPVPAGQTANFTLRVLAPKDPGAYQLQVDLVEELVTFFSTKGTEKLTVPVTVQ